jgi:hypothetical protein
MAILMNGRYSLSEAEAKTEGKCVLPYIDPEKAAYSQQEVPITCYSRNSCYDTTDWYPVNPYSISSINTHSMQQRCKLAIHGLVFSPMCYEINNAVAYCDQTFSVEPVAILAIRGTLIGVILLCLLMFVFDGVIAFRLYRLRRLILDHKDEVLAESIPHSRRDLMQRCLLKWNSLLSRTNSILSQSQPVTPSSSSSPRTVGLPFQPVLSPRTSFAFKAKESPLGYSPRMDSPPVQVLSTINRTTSRLTRAHGAVEVMFATTWRKRVSNYFKLRAKMMKTLRLSPFRRIMHLGITILLCLSLFVLLFRFVMFLSAELPLTKRLPGSLTILDVFNLGDSDRIGSVGSIIGDDFTADNTINQRVMYIWVICLAFLDVIWESWTLLVLGFMAMLRPTKLTITRLVSGDDLHPHVLKMEETRLDTTVGGFSSPMSGDSEVDMDASPGPQVNTIKLPSQFIPRSRRQSLTSSSIGNLDEVMVAKDDPAICILLSVMSPCATADGKKLFVDQLQSLRNLVENDRDIFVIDCGFTRSPIDDTESVVYDEVSDKIHYVYFPEPNRVLSLYWTSKYWIPFLFTSNLCGDYIYTLILEGESGVVFPQDFKLPSADLLLGNPGIKALYIPINETPSLVEWPHRLRERIYLGWLSNILKSSTHAGDYGIPQIWERNSFEMTCFNLSAGTNSDPRVYKSLSLKANGRMLLRDRSKSLMAYWLPQNGAKPILRTPVWKGEKRDISFGSNVRELLEPASLLHATSFLSKFAIFDEILNSFFDAFRLFLIPAFLVRDPIGVAIVAIIVGLVSVLPLMITVLLSVRFEEHVTGKLFFLIILQPLSLVLLEIPRRVVRLFKHKFIPSIYRFYESDVSIGEREEQLGDLPIVPPHPVPHWPTVWT